MTRIAIPNETCPQDQRTAMTPINVGKLTRAGAKVLIEPGLGAGRERHVLARFRPHGADPARALRAFRAGVRPVGAITGCHERWLLVRKSAPAPGLGLVPTP